MLVLEVRGAEGKGSINQKGNYQGAEAMGIEVHLKDEARFPGKWAFFTFDNGKTAKKGAWFSGPFCFGCFLLYPGGIESLPAVQRSTWARNTIGSIYRGRPHAQLPQPRWPEWLLE